MVHCITLAVPVSGRRFATALDWYSQGDTVDHINQRSVLSINYFLAKSGHVSNIDFVQNFIILMTVALWEICCGIFSFLQISEMEGH